MNGLGGQGRQAQLFTVPQAGGLPEQLAVPYGGYGTISGDGQWLAYTPRNRDFRTWKRYRGGWASDIWLFHLENHTSRQLTDWEGTDTVPMWQGQTLYFPGVFLNTITKAQDKDAIAANIWELTEGGRVDKQQQNADM